MKAIPRLPVPRSLFGQIMLALAAALIVAQAISAGLLYHAGTQRQEEALLHSAAFQLLGNPAENARQIRNQARHARPHLRRFRHEVHRLPRAIRFETRATSPLFPGETRSSEREAALRTLLAGQDIPVAEIVVTERSPQADPFVRGAMRGSPRLQALLADRDASMLVVGVRHFAQGPWVVVRVPAPRPDRALLPGLLVQTAILFVVLVGLVWLVVRRMTRPLAVLAERTRRFSGTANGEPPLIPSGPDDIRRLILAHNAMQARIGAMLDEKDVMLGAIGHDLKTPLSALRVRIEDVADPAARRRMAETIEDIVHTLDEILALARVGRPAEIAERADLRALAGAVVEEFEDMGEAVTLAEGERVVAPVRLTWLKRGLRNLVANAVRYAGSAEVSLAREGAEAVLRVADRGPGIAEELLTTMTEPFARGEASRNRETGGAGLGLALARAVAEQHGGRLVLANRPGGGLVAEIRLPAG